MTAKLHSVQTPADKPIDITQLNRIDIMERDWSSALIWADRQKPVELPNGRRKARWS